MKINQIQSLIGGISIPSNSVATVKEPIVHGNLALADTTADDVIQPSKGVKTEVKLTTHKEGRNDIKSFVKSGLVDGKDYGNIPGVQHKVLFKSGALKILRHLHYRHQDELVDKTVDIANGFLGYTVRVIIISQDGEVVTEALGAANSLEPKFSKQGFGGDRLLVAMASKRALICAVKELI